MPEQGQFFCFLSSPILVASLDFLNNKHVDEARRTPVPLAGRLGAAIEVGRFEVGAFPTPRFLDFASGFGASSRALGGLGFRG